MRYSRYIIRTVIPSCFVSVRYQNRHITMVKSFDEVVVTGSDATGTTESTFSGPHSNKGSATGSTTGSTGTTTAFNSANHYSDHVTRFTKPHAFDLIDATYNEILHAKNILEIGCGTGVFGLAFLERFPNGIPGQTIHCTDFSQDMVDVTERLIMEKRDDSCQTEFIFEKADGTKLEMYNDGKFDMVVSVFGLFLIPDRDTVLAEVRRVLQTKNGGGTLATTAWTTTGYNEELRLSGFGANLHDAMSLMRLPAKSTDQTTASTIINKTPQQILPQFILDWFEPNKVRAILTDNARFHNISVHRVIHSVCVPNVETMWNTFSAGKSTHPTDMDTLQQLQETITAAKIVLGEYIAIDGNIDRPLFIRTVSNIIIAQ